MKKVAILSPTYAPSIWSGLGRHTFYLTHSLGKMGYDVSVYIYGPDTTFRAHDGQATVIRVGCDCPNDKTLPASHLMEWNNRVLGEMQSEQFDVMMLPTCHGWPAAKAYSQTRNIPTIGFVPFLLAVTGWIASINADEEQLMLAIEREFLSNATTLICHNEQFGNAVAEISSHEVVVIPSSYQDMFDDHIKPVAKEKGSIVHVGKINKEKSLETVLHAVAKLGSGVTLKLCYPENARVYVTRLQSLAARLGITDRVEFIGWLPATDVKQLYASAQFAVVPSKHESYGYPALDPMAYGTIPLVSHLSGLGEYVTPDETFTSHVNLAKMLDKALTTDNLAKVIAPNKCKLETLYSERTIMSQLESVMR